MPKSNIETVQVEAAEVFLFYSFLLRTRGREVLRTWRIDMLSIIKESYQGIDITHCSCLSFGECLFVANLID